MRLASANLPTDGPACGPAARHGGGKSIPTAIAWRVGRCFVWLGAISLWLGGPAGAPRVWAEADPPEAEAESVMATYLLHFARLATWPRPTPAPAAKDPPPPLVIGVLGPDPFGARLDDAFAGETFAGRPAVVRRMVSEEEALNCQVLFIARSEVPRAANLLATLRNRPVLTVSDAPGFVAAGGMIGFHREQGKVVFDIEPEAVRRVGITLSSRLLRLANNLRPTAGGGR